MDKIQLRNTILEKIELPQIPNRIFYAEEYGIMQGSHEIQTEQICEAIHRISLSGGGRLVLPAGAYRTGAIRLESCVELHLEKGAELHFVSEEPEKHYPLVFCHWEATPCYNFSPLIYACDAHDIALTGEGILDGGADADHWWNWHHQVENAWSKDKTDMQLADRKLLREMNMAGIPVSERIFGPGHYLRPNFVQPIRCRRVLLQGFTLKNSPMWQLNPVMCESLTVDGVTMSSHGSNNDGCDPESCHGVVIRSCRFDTGDDCISLKSGRDRDGREANVPCEYVLIEQNVFADGHGGVALGSEMSGGIHSVLAIHNRFSSPNLTYALRLKTNARRGGRVENVILADSVMDSVHGAAVHGTMLYEDGRNGEDLPVFRDILIENIEAHGGDYGIFLEAFDEVPITGLTLRNIMIDGAEQMMRSMNWKDPVIENVTINGRRFPRPVNVRILGVPSAGKIVSGYCEGCGAAAEYQYFWSWTKDRSTWHMDGEGMEYQIPWDAVCIRLKVTDAAGNEEHSRIYTVLDSAGEEDLDLRRLECRGIIRDRSRFNKLWNQPITRLELASMLLPFSEKKNGMKNLPEYLDLLELAVRNTFLSFTEDGSLCPDGLISRQEMATVAMQACGINYRNASSTMPSCTDRSEVSNNYGTNVARALYFGFMQLEQDGCFLPKQCVTHGEAVEILNRVADFAGL